VYYRLLRRLDLPVDSLAPGSYRLFALVSTARQDIAPQHVLPALPVEQSVGIVLP
jgi:hypothetical protein